MRRLRATTAALSLLLLATSPAYATTGPVTAKHRLPGAFPTIAADDAGGVFAATTRDRRLLVQHRPAAGPWSGTASLARGVDFGPVLAAGGKGVAVAAWARTRKGAMSVLARVRRTDGAWGPQQTLAAGNELWAAPVAADVNGRGDVALMYADATETSTYAVAVLPAGGTWRTLPVAEQCATYSLGLDDLGTVHLACTSSPGRGSIGPAVVLTAPAGAGWTSRQVASAEEGAAEISLRVTPDGQETVLVGYTGRAYPYDDGAPRSRRFAVLRQAAAGFTAVWQRSNAVSAVLATSGARVQVTWEEWSGGRLRRLPARAALHTQTVLPVAGPAQRIVSRRFTGPDAAAALYALDATTDAVLWAVTPADVDAPLGARRITRLRDGQLGWTRVLSPRTAQSHFGAVVATSDGRTYVAWETSRALVARVRPV